MKSNQEAIVQAENQLDTLLDMLAVCDNSLVSRMRESIWKKVNQLVELEVQNAIANYSELKPDRPINTLI